MAATRVLLAITLLLITAPASRAATTVLGDLHCNDAAGNSLNVVWPVIQPVSVTGIVTAQFPTSGVVPSTRLYIEDNTGGLNVFGAPQYCGGIGDLIRVDGVFKQFNGLTEIALDGPAGWPKITWISSGNPLPMPLVLSPAQVAATFQADGCEPNESRLVTVTNVFIRDTLGAMPILAETFGVNRDYRLVNAGPDSATNYTRMRVYAVTACGMSQPWIGMLIPLMPVDVTGVLEQFQRTGPFTSGYEVLPRFTWDIAPSIATPVSRATWGRLKLLYR